MSGEKRIMAIIIKFHLTKVFQTKVFCLLVCADHRFCDEFNEIHLISLLAGVFLTSIAINQHLALPFRCCEPEIPLREHGGKG